MKDRYNSKSYSAVCDECGRSCELPFKPSFGKPVYCRDCFEKKQRENSGRSNFRNNNRPSFRNNNRSSFKERRMYPAVCDSCGRECEVPFRPTSGKPVYCDSCFNKNNNNKRNINETGDKDENQLKKQIATMNLKLDKIMRALEIIGEEKVSEREKPNKIKKDRKEKAILEREKKIIKKVLAKKQRKKTTKKTTKKKVTKKNSKKK